MTFVDMLRCILYHQLVTQSYEFQKYTNVICIKHVVQPVTNLAREDILTLVMVEKLQSNFCEKFRQTRFSNFPVAITTTNNAGDIQI